ncbi:MAG TPA: hypothetical protein EYH30_11755 [Anaerolineales bacterium]|nr:hypothetical protein [Anaerolineales bacterium]
METVRTVVESFIRLVKAEIDPEAVLVAADDVFEVPRTPSLILQGPTLIVNGDRRTQARMVEKDVPNLSYEECRYPRLYHLDFDVIVTAAHEGELLDLQEKVARFYQRYPVLTVEDRGTINLTELTPLGGLRRVNLSDLRQSSGRCRIEDCPVYDGVVETGPLVKDRRFEFRDGVEEDRTYTP